MPLPEAPRQEKAGEKTEGRAVQTKKELRHTARKTELKKEGMFSLEKTKGRWHCCPHLPNRRMERRQKQILLQGLQAKDERRCT